MIRSRKLTPRSTNKVQNWSNRDLNTLVSWASRSLRFFYSRDRIDSFCFLCLNFYWQWKSDPGFWFPVQKSFQASIIHRWRSRTSVGSARDHSTRTVSGNLPHFRGMLAIGRQPVFVIIIAGLVRLDEVNPVIWLAPWVKHALSELPALFQQNPLFCYRIWLCGTSFLEKACALDTWVFVFLPSGKLCKFTTSQLWGSERNHNSFFFLFFFLFRIEEIHDEPEEDDDNSKEETDDTVKPAR